MDRFKQTLKVLVTAFIVFALLGSIALLIYNNANTSESTETPHSNVERVADLEDNSKFDEDYYDDPYIASMNNKSDYREMVFGDFVENTPIVGIGTVDQVLEGNKLRVATGDVAFDSMADYFLYDTKFAGKYVIVSLSETPRALVGDYVAVKGRYSGVVEYKTALDGVINIPTIKADYYQAETSTKALSEFFANRKLAIKKINEQIRLANEAKVDQQPQPEASSSISNDDHSSANTASKQADQIPTPKKPEPSQQNENTKSDDQMLLTTHEDGPHATRGDVERIMSQAKGRLQSAFKRALDEDPTIQGSIIVKLRIAPDGNVLSATIVSSELNNSALESKMLSMMKGLVFDSGDYEVWEDTYKFNFIPQ